MYIILLFIMLKWRNVKRGRKIFSSDITKLMYSTSLYPKINPYAFGEIVHYAKRSQYLKIRVS